MFGPWKNNGPRPPWSDEEILAILILMLKFMAVYIGIVAGLNILALAVLEVLRRHHIGL